MPLTIITLIISIAALVVSAVDYLKYRKYDESLRELASLTNQYKGLEERIADMNQEIPSRIWRESPMTRSHPR